MVLVWPTIVRQREAEPRQEGVPLGLDVVFVKSNAMWVVVPSNFNQRFLIDSTCPGIMLPKGELRVAA